MVEKPIPNELFGCIDIARYGDEIDRIHLSRCKPPTQFFRHLDTIESGHLNVEEKHVGCRNGNLLKNLDTIGSGLDYTAKFQQQTTKDSAGLSIVVGQHHRETCEIDTGISSLGRVWVLLAFQAL